MTEPEDLTPGAAAEILHRFANRKRSRLVVEIDLDPIPGWGDNAEDHRKLVQSLLLDSIPHYHPTVTIEGGAA